MKKFNPVLLPYMGAAVQAVLYGLAGYKYFNLGLWGGAAGLGMGALVNLSMAVASSRISDIAKSRKRLAYLSLAALFCLSPVVIVSSLGWSVATLSWSLAADLAILLTGAIAGGSLVAKDKPKDEKVAGKDAGKKRKKDVKPAQLARKHVKDDELLAYFQGQPGATDTQAAEYFGISRQAVGQRRKKLYSVSVQVEPAKP